MLPLRYVSFMQNGQKKIQLYTVDDTLRETRIDVTLCAMRAMLPVKTLTSVFHASSFNVQPSTHRQFTIRPIAAKRDVIHKTGST